MLVIAGSETTRNALSAGLLAFLKHPEQIARFNDTPALRETTADEVLRWTSPVLFFARTAACDTVLNGVDIKADERVSIWYPSANRDSREFSDPYQFDIGRTPNRQTAFGGGGPHLCLGSHLARKQIQTLFTELWGRTRNHEIDTPHWYVAGLQNNVTCSLAPFRLRVDAK